ncbi:MAG: hypothetical protein WBF62_03450, partial [Bradyrhizobium sp.]
TRAPIPKFASNRGTPFTNFEKLWALANLRFSCRFLFEVPDPNSPPVAQELQIGGTSLQRSDIPSNH